jgi:hypothetical protein
MLLNDVAVDGTSTTITYSLVSIVNGSSVRRDATAALDSPRDLLIKHEQVSKGSLFSDRHLIRFERTALQAETLVPVKGAVHLVIEAPRTTITAAMIIDMIAQLRDMLSDAAIVAKILNSEP